MWYSFGLFDDYAHVFKIFTSALAFIIHVLSGSELIDYLNEKKMYEKITQTVQYLSNLTDMTPEVGIILGTGLGRFIDDIDIELAVNYADIPNFPISTVESHSGRLVFGSLSGKSVIVMHGRFHYYEGYSMDQVVFPVRVMKLLGIGALYVSNAAGGLNPAFQKSDLMIIEDHINFQTANPLIGKNLDQLGHRFPDMSQPYSRRLIDRAHRVAEIHKIHTKEGIYVSVPGPSLETRAEYRMLRMLGGDAVGMSTVPEVIVARHMNLAVFAVSVITDLCDPDNLKPITLEEVIEVADKAEPNLVLLFREMLKIV